MTTLGTALFSNSTSIKASGSVSAATTLSGTQALQSAKLTINGVDVATQAGALVAPTTVSGAGSVSGQKLTINGSDIITAAKALGNVTTISGASSLAGASLTINGTERISQNGDATFVDLTADTLDVREINNTSVTTTTLEIADKLVIVASGANASNTNQAGIQFGGTSGSNAISSILWQNGNSRLSSSTALHVGGAFTGHTTISGASSLAGAKLTINGSDIVSQAKAIANVTTITAASTISGTSGLVANRISGSTRGMTTLGTAIFSHATSIKASGSISAATTLSGTAGLSAASLTINSKEVVGQGNILGVTIGNASTISSSAQLSSAKLTIAGSDIITQAKNIQSVGNISGSGQISGSSLRINGSVVATQAGALVAPTTVSGASSLAGAKLTINGSDIVSQAKAIANVTTIAAAGNITGAADLTVNRISGSERGTTLLGPVVLSNTGDALVVSGNVGIGKTDPFYMLEVNSSEDNGAVMAITQYDDDTGGDAPNLYFRRGRGTEASTSVVQDGDDLGAIDFYGHDGTNFEHAAGIRAEVDGTPNNDATDMPGRLLFSTTPDGSDAASERMRIDNAGNIGIGRTPVQLLHVDGLISGSALQVKNKIIASGSITSVTTVSGASSLAGAKLTINGSDIVSQAKAIANVTTITAAGNVSGTSDLTANRISGSSRGMTTLGTALFTNSTSIKASGSISAGTTVSGTTGLSSAKLTINGSDVITQAKNIQSVGNISGSGQISGSSLRINGSDVITQAKAIDNVATITTPDLTVSGKAHVSGGIDLQDSSLTLTTNLSVDSAAFGVIFNKSGHNTDGSHTIVAEDELLGFIGWAGSDGTDFETAAQIRALVDGTPNNDSTDMPGRLEFQTTPDGADSATTKMTIDNAGLVTVVANISGAADIIANRISGSSRGMTTLGTALFSNSTSIKASGSISAATTLSGTQALQSAKLTIDGSDVITQAKTIQSVGNISGSGQISGSSLRIGTKAGGDMTISTGGVVSSSAGMTLLGPSFHDNVNVSGALAVSSEGGTITKSTANNTLNFGTNNNNNGGYDSTTGDMAARAGTVIGQINTTDLGGSGVAYGNVSATGVLVTDAIVATSTGGFLIKVTHVAANGFSFEAHNNTGGAITAHGSNSSAQIKFNWVAL